MSGDMPEWAERNSTPMRPEEIAGLKYLEEMSSEEAAQYGGEWIAVWGSKVVAHGKDAGAVCDEARRAGAKSPILSCIYGSPDEVVHFPSVMMPFA